MKFQIILLIIVQDIDYFYGESHFIFQVLSLHSIFSNNLQLSPQYPLSSVFFVVFPKFMPEALYFPTLKSLVLHPSILYFYFPHHTSLQVHYLFALIPIFCKQFH